MLFHSIREAPVLSSILKKCMQQIFLITPVDIKHTITAGNDDFLHYSFISCTIFVDLFATSKSCHAHLVLILNCRVALSPRMSLQITYQIPAHLFTWNLVN